MPLAMGLVPLIRRAVSTGVDFLHFIHFLRTEGISYVFGEVGDRYGLELANMAKREALSLLSPNEFLPLRQIIKRPMKQRANFHISGIVQIWDRATGELVDLPIHVFTNQWRSIGGYNQLLIDTYERFADPSKYKTAYAGALVTYAKTTQIEENVEEEF